MKKGLIDMVVNDEWMVQAAQSRISKTIRFPSDAPIVFGIEALSCGGYRLLFSNPTQPPPPKQEE